VRLSYMGHRAGGLLLLPAGIDVTFTTREIRMTDEPTTERVAVRWRIPAAIGMVVAGIGVAAIIVGATTGGTAAKSATTAAAPAAQLLNAPSASPGSSPAAGDDGNGWAGPGGRMGGRGMMGGRMGGRGMMGEIAITGIAGSQLSLKTTDGWTRTIDATGAAIEKDGKTATLADLKVGDQIALQQTRGTDGVFTVTAIVVVQPHVAGTVTAVDASTISIKQFDGIAKTVQVTASTTYASGRTAADKSAVTVGSLVMIRGIVAADGTFTATAVDVGPAAGPNGGPGAWPDHDKNGGGRNGNGPNGGPDASPNASPAAGA
jgi:predicted ribosome-associated RNA-binding protein Tma20